MLEIKQGYGAPTNEPSRDAEPESYFVLLIPQRWVHQEEFDVSVVVRYMSAVISDKNSPFWTTTKQEFSSV